MARSSNRSHLISAHASWPQAPERTGPRSAAVLVRRMRASTKAEHLNAMSLSADRGSRHAALVVPMEMHALADEASRHHRRASRAQPSQVPRRTRCLMIAQPSSSRRRVLAQDRRGSCLRTSLRTCLRTDPSTSPQTSVQPCRCCCRSYHRARHYRRALMIARHRPLPDVAVNADARVAERAPLRRH